MNKLFMFLTYFISILFFGQTCVTQTKFHLIAAMSGDTTAAEFNVVTFVGDVNVDGYNDVLVGAPHANYVKLFYGGAVFDTIPDLVFHCEQVGSRFGWALAGGKDINGDGYPDFVIGAPYYWYGGKPFGISQSGKIYVYFGGPNIDSIADAEILVDKWYYNFGNSVTLGDINGDGYADIIVGAYMDDIDARGRVYIYFGGKQIRTTPDIVLEGTGERDTFGSSTSYVDDVNKDGYGDFLIGAPQSLLSLSKFQGGKAYLFYGGHSIGFTNSTLFKGDSVTPGQFGRVVTGLGDINGDGFDDIGIMGLKKINLYFGKSQVDTVPSLSLYPLKGFGYIGRVSDINGDGYNDWIAVSDSTRIYFGAVSPDTFPIATLPGGRNVCTLGNINADSHPEIAIGNDQGYGADGPGVVSIYSFGSPVEVKEDKNIKYPKQFALSQNFPNPFNPTTTISYQLPSNGFTTLKVYDVLGREVAVLVNEQKDAGTYSVQWNASQFSSGMYFAKMTAGSFSSTKKLLLMK